MLKRYEVKYNVGLNSDVRTAQCLLDETQSALDFGSMIAISDPRLNVRDASIINIIEYKRLTFDGFC